MMIRTILICIVVSQIECIQDFPALNHIRTKTSSYRQAETVKGLIERLIGARSSEFDVVVDASVGVVNKDTFKLSSSGNHVLVQGTTGVAAAWGFYYYLSKYCNCHVSWGGDQLNIPDQLPQLPSGGVSITSSDRFRYYQNVCTPSYSFAWYNWTQWEREIDWMALNGINFALAFNGQETIWQKVYLKMGFTQAEIDGHFGGPAFLAWFRMGNMRGWGGPLPQSWHGQQLLLQHKILQRMRDFGMIPILPAFNGDVPNAITRLYPEAKVTHLSDWGSFNATYCCTLLLDLNDPLFKTIGKAFLDEYINEFGTDHVYNTDTFNEMAPPSGDPAYLSSAGKAVYDALTAADPDAVWVMQGWLFLGAEFWTPERVKALVTAPPLGRMIILDLFSEVLPQYNRLQSYFGQPFIWCMLNNFGGTLSLYGAVESINTGPSIGRNFTNSSMIGTGLTMEGINQNYVIYEFMLENGWRKEARNITHWVENYAMRRYGSLNDDVTYAWTKLMGSVYNCTLGGGYQNHGSDIIITRPRLHNPIRPQVWYDPKDVFIAWDHFILAADKFSSSKLFKYDLVDLTRHSLNLYAIVFYNNMIDAYNKKNLSSFLLSSESLLTLLLDLEELLSTDEHFLLGRWLESAKSLAVNEKQRMLYEYNARNQITLWGPSGNILDYANKQWSGLVEGYYYPRWRKFSAELMHHWNDTFNEQQFNADVFNYIEQPFTFSQSIYPTTPSGLQIEVATRLYKRYRSLASFELSTFFSRLARKNGFQTQLKEKLSHRVDSGMDHLLQ